MLVLRLRHSLPLRVAEWTLASILLSWGAVLLATPDMFATVPQYSEMARWVPQHAWGWGCSLLGLASIVVLVINGTAPRATPVLRAVFSMMRALIWAQIFVGLIVSGVVVTGLAIYPWLIVLEGWNVVQAGKDAREAGVTRGA